MHLRLVARKIFEHRSEPLLGTWAYARRQLWYVFAALLFIGVSLAIGTIGYMHFARFTFADAFLNASMILSGMGPVGELTSDGAKYFAALYAIYSGVALLTTVALILAPLVHRFLHMMHLDEKD